MQMNLTDKKKQIREEIHLTRPPRLESKVKNSRMNPVKKPKKTMIHFPPTVKEPVYMVTENGYEECSEEDRFRESF